MVIMTLFAFITGWIHVNHPIITMNDKLRNVGLFGSDSFHMSKQVAITENNFWKRRPVGKPMHFLSI